MTMKINGTLPVLLTALDGQKVIKSKDVTMTQMTVEEYFESQKNMTDGQYVAIAELAAMTKLVDADGVEYPVTYQMLIATSRQNYDALIALRGKLDAKEQAESEVSEQV